MKVHLQANAGHRREPMAMCSTTLTSSGTVRDNGRRSYVGMGSPIVKLAQFKETSPQDRCAHCCDILKDRRNMKRRREGLAPVSAYNEGWENP